MSLDSKEEQAIKGAILSATHKMAKLVQKGRLVSVLDFKEMVEKAYKGDFFMLTIEEINYHYQGYDGPCIGISCSLNDQKYRASFYMGEPPGTFRDRTPIPHNIMVEKFILRDENSEEDIWGVF